MQRVAIKLVDDWGNVEWRFGIMVKDDVATGTVHVSEVHQRLVDLGRPDRVQVCPLWKSTLHAGFQRYCLNDRSVAMYEFDGGNTYLNRTRVIDLQ